MRRTLHELLHIGDALKRFLNHSFIRLRKLGLAAQLLDVIAVSRSARNSACRGMRLLKIPGISQVSHNVPDRRGTQPFPARPRKHARTDRLARGDECLHQRGQNLAFPVTNGLPRRHASLLYTPTQRVPHSSHIFCGGWDLDFGLDPGALSPTSRDRLSRTTKSRLKTVTYMLSTLTSEIRTCAYFNGSA